MVRHELASRAAAASEHVGESSRSDERLHTLRHERRHHRLELHENSTQEDGVKMH